MHSEMITQIKDIVVAVSAAVGAISAWRGVDTWRKQLVGKSEYELAKRLLKSAFEIEKLIKRIRLTARMESDEELWDKLDKVGAECDVAFLEGRVQWGDQLFELKAPIAECVNQLRYSSQRIDDSRAVDVPNAEIDSILNEHKPIARGWTADDSDDFSCKVHSAIEKLEKALRPHLRR